jgi:hypothetical protein
MLKIISISFFVVTMLLNTSFEARASSCNSLATGVWTNANTWSCGHEPEAKDDVTINAGHTITMSGDHGVAASLVINGTAYWSQSRSTDVGTGRVTINSGGNITDAANGVLTSTGGLTINAILSSANVTIVLNKNEKDDDKDKDEQTSSEQTVTGSGALARLEVNTSVTNNGTLKVGTSLSGSGALINAATLEISGASTIAALNAGMTGNTVIYSGNSAQSIKASSADNTYHHLTLSGSGYKTAPDMLILTGNFTNNGTFTPESDSTVSFVGSVSQSISGNTLFNHLTFANTADPGTVNAGNFVHNVQGDFTDNGSFISGTGEIVFSGSTAQSLTGDVTVTTFNKLTMNNSKGLTLLHDVTVNTLLICTSGTMSTGSNKVSIGATGSLGSASADSYVNGRLEKNFPAAASFTFAIGDTENYTPVEVNFTSMSHVGKLTVFTTAGDHPDIATSGLNKGRNVNRYWTLSSTDITGVYDVTLNFVAADVDYSANTGEFIIRRQDDGKDEWKDVTLVAANPTSTAGSDISAANDDKDNDKAGGFGDFVVGEVSVPILIREKELIYMQELYN